MTSRSRASRLQVAVFTSLVAACGTDAAQAPTTVEVVSEDGGAGSTPTPPPPPPPPSGSDAGLPEPGVVISEIMYHPVDEEAVEDNHEFIEIHNRGTSARDLAGWKLSTGGEFPVRYTFPPGTTIPAKGYRVIAKKVSALVAIPAYGLTASEVLGDYAGELHNGGATISLTDATGAPIDTVVYRDGFPYPIAADALGADEEWLQRLTPERTRVGHRFKGHSLERVSADVPSSEISNWAPSPLDGATPGRPNASASPVPPAIVKAIQVIGATKDKPIRSGEDPKISVTFSTLGKVTSPTVEWFVDDLQTTGEPLTVTPLTAAGSAWQATLPRQPDGSIVRYRIRADRGAGAEVVSPRATDPMEWHAYFVSPVVTLPTPGNPPTTEPVYHIFIHKDEWTRMYDNTYTASPDTRRVDVGGNPAAPGNRCLVRESWNAAVPAVFVHDGAVSDVFARYQGSRWQRLNGITLDRARTTISTYPDRPAPNAAPSTLTPAFVLSWKIDFPAYAKHEGKRGTVALNKLNQSCPGIHDAVGALIYADPAVDIPVQKARFVRVHVNGGYYHYMMDIEHFDVDMMKRYSAPGERVGDMFKSDGNSSPATVEGPWGIGNASLLPVSAACPNWTVDERYAYTYSRATHKWDTPALVRTMIEELNAVRTTALASGDWTPVRAWFTANWDIKRLRDLIVIRNWAQPWDDGFHNHRLYRRAGDGKWSLLPQDKDLEWGHLAGFASNRTQASFLNTQFNTIKDTFIKAFTPEVWARLVELNATVLSPANFRAKVDQADATFSRPDYAASPAAGAACNADGVAPGMKIWAGCRHQDVLQLTDNCPPSTLAIGTNGTCGFQAPVCNPGSPSPY